MAAEYFLLSPFVCLSVNVGKKWFLELCLHFSFCPNRVISTTQGKKLEALCVSYWCVEVFSLHPVDSNGNNPRAKQLYYPLCTVL